MGFWVGIGSGVPLALWVGLLLLRGMFWRSDVRLPAAPPATPHPHVAVVIPARNEAETIGVAVASLRDQDYAGTITVVVVDDGSTDGTATAARLSQDVVVVQGRPLPEGWTGKLWAVHQGLETVAARAPDAIYVLMTDADIEHGPASVRRLVAKAEAERLDLVSLMVQLHCEGAWERLLIPAFVFFFQKLFPFPWVNDRRRSTAGAAGGCMLVRRSALDAAGGVRSIRDRVIDDCALAERLKARGPIWLGLTGGIKSLRRYDRLQDIWHMVARTAYTQLRHSPAALLATVLGMTVLYLVPPFLALAGVLAGRWPVAATGVGAWALMAFAYAPTLRRYGRPAWHGLALPVAAFLYTLMTLDSARRHRLGRGGAWKGRTYGRTPAAGP